jgi:PAS domain S-box-containing protein
MRQRLRGLGEILGSLADAEATLAQMAGVLLTRNLDSDVTVAPLDDDLESSAARALPGAILIAERSGGIIGATANAAELLGYHSQILSRSRVTELLEIDQSTWETLRSQSDAASGPSEAHAFNCKRGDGSVIQLSIRVAALSVGEDRNYALTFSGERIVNDTRDERGVRLAMARYQAIVEQIPAITFIASLDGKGNDLYVSPQIEALLGFTQRQWLDDPTLWFRQLHPDDREKLHQEFSRGLLTGGPFRAEVRVLTRGGEVVWVRGEARLVKDSNGCPLFFQGVAFDITDAKRAERQLEEAHRAKLGNERLAAIGQLAASISHDLRNPLGSIRNAWYYIRRKLEATQVFAADARIERLCGVIESELGRCVAIIGDLLDFTRDPPLRLVECNLPQLLDEAIYAAVPRSGIKVLREYATEIPKPYLDQTRFRQMVINLLENAVHAVDPAHGQIAVRLARDADRFVLEIEDDGKGMSSEVKERIFEPLFTTKTKGAGLGLCIVNNIVRSHRGTISLDSVPEKGTKFQIRIPIGENGSTLSNQPKSGG